MNNMQHFVFLIRRLLFIKKYSRYNDKYFRSSAIHYIDFFFSSGGGAKE